jgi:FtsP/CotA-like multicopper oxidase with cupredoxin domain
VLTLSKAVFGAVLTLATAAATPVAAQTAANRSVEPNDNVRAAGAVSHDVLTVRLVADRGTWRPEGPDSPALDVAAFAQEGDPLQIPGPAIRVAANTEIVVSVRNALAEPLFVHGLMPRPARSDEVFIVPPGETKERRFASGRAGTYYYWAASGRDTTINARKTLDTQLGGVFVVDDPNAPNDRVFVLTEWNGRNGPSAARSSRLFTINGQSWPFTERLSATVGETMHWRWVNLTTTSHPMHLHGFYFRVTGDGSGLDHEAFARDEQREVVTQNLAIGAMIEMTWMPDRPGQWLLHCHTLGHISPDLRFWSRDHEPHLDHATHDPSQAMAGLVMGITVTGSALATARTELPVRHLTLAMYRRPQFWERYDAYAFALSDGGEVPRADSATVPGPRLILTRGQPVEIDVKNEMPDATSVHWHGIELDSYYDGVAGFSGTRGSTTPLIGPGESFRVRFTPRRAGTFIYHTHSHDSVQLTSGLYGPVVVLEPGESFDPTTDHIVTFGMVGPIDALNPNRMPIAVNGKPTDLNLPEGPKPQLTLKAGVPNRVRLINITTIVEASVSLVTASGALEWTPVKKDGADVPMRERRQRSAKDQVIAVGETYDFIVTPRHGGPTWLEVRYAPTGMWIQQVPIAIDVSPN